MVKEHEDERSTKIANDETESEEVREETSEEKEEQTDEKEEEIEEESQPEISEEEKDEDEDEEKSIPITLDGEFSEPGMFQDTQIPSLSAEDLILTSGESAPSQSVQITPSLERDLASEPSGRTLSPGEKYAPSHSDYIDLDGDYEKSESSYYPSSEKVPGFILTEDDREKLPNTILSSKARPVESTMERAPMRNQFEEFENFEKDYEATKLERSPDGMKRTRSLKGRDITKTF